MQIKTKIKQTLLKGVAATHNNIEIQYNPEGKGVFLTMAAVGANPRNQVWCDVKAANELQDFFKQLAEILEN